MDRNVEMFLNVEKNLVQVPSDEHNKFICLFELFYMVFGEIIL